MISYDGPWMIIFSLTSHATSTMRPSSPHVLVVADDDDDPRRTTRMEGGRRHPTPSTPHQSFSLPGDICNTILHAAKNKGAGINADSIDLFKDPQSFL